MIANNTIKAAIVAQTQAVPTLTGTVLPDGAKGVAEINWRGDVFSYPNVRIGDISQTDQTPDSNCTPVIIDWSVYVFSEKHSSLEADNIAGLIVVYFKDRNFTSNGLRFVRVGILENIAAIQDDPNTWRAQVRCRSIVYAV